MHVCLHVQYTRRGKLVQDISLLTSINVYGLSVPWLDSLQHRVTVSLARQPPLLLEKLLVSFL